MKYYEGKTVLITGAFGGFGRHFIFQLIDSGAKLILTDLTAPPLTEVVADDEQRKSIIAVIPSDLSTSEGCRELYDEVKKLNTDVDVIIHNAGIFFLGAYTDAPLANSEKVINLNLLSVMRLNSLFLPELIQRQSGHLIYVSSVAGFVATPYAVPYTASKFGLRAFAMAVNREVKRFGVRSSIVYPFWSKTPIMKCQVFGDPKIKTMPDFYASEPEYVVRTALRGASRGKLHICPGIFSKLMWLAVKFIPVTAEQRFMREGLIG